MMYADNALIKLVTLYSEYNNELTDSIVKLLKERKSLIAAVEAAEEAFEDHKIPDQLDSAIKAWKKDLQFVNEFIKSET